MNGEFSNGSSPGGSDRTVVDDRPRSGKFSETAHSAADSWNALFLASRRIGGDLPTAADRSSPQSHSGDSKYKSAGDKPSVNSDHTFPAQNTVTLLSNLEANLQAKLDRRAEPASDKSGEAQDAAGSSPETPPDRGDDPTQGPKDTKDPGKDRPKPSPPDGSHPGDTRKKPKKMGSGKDWEPPDYKKFFDRHPGGGGGGPASGERGPTPLEHWLKETQERREKFDAAIAWNQQFIRRAKLEAPGVVGDMAREEEKRRHPAG